MDRKCLIITDVQNDFCSGGALEIKDADEIVPVINEIAKKFDKVIATQDWHPVDHVSFASNHENMKIGDIIKVDGEDQFLWPDHCVRGSRGADFNDLLNLNPVDLIIRKGSNKNMDSYSTFFENDKKTGTGLEYYINGFGIKDVYLCGLATDYCVYYSAMDAKKLGFNTYVILDATKGVDLPENNLVKSIEDMEKNGIKIIDHTGIK